MRLHTIFEGGPANGFLTTIDVGTFDQEEPPTEIRIAAVDTAGESKVTAWVYRLVGSDPSPIPRQYMATYRYSHNYEDLPITLVDQLITQEDK